MMTLQRAFSLSLAHSIGLLRKVRILTTYKALVGELKSETVMHLSLLLWLHLEGGIHIRPTSELKYIYVF